MKNLNNKNAVITGGSDGIGLGIAKAFAREGANLLLIGKDPEKLQKAQQELLNEFGVQVHTLSADLPLYLYVSRLQLLGYFLQIICVPILHWQRVIAPKEL